MRPFLGFTKKVKYIAPCVVWAEESKNGLRFEIGPSYDDVPAMFQCVTGGQSSYIAVFSHV